MWSIVSRVTALATSTSVLVVEDDQSIRDLIQEALELEGYVVEVVRNGKEALDRLNLEPMPALILLDLMLPQLSGWELIDIVRKNQHSLISRIPIVITSAAGDSAVILAQEVDGHIKKPLDLDILLETVAKYCQPKEII